ncbi:transferase hexapeptide (six repeat-containing protein) [Pedobacter steynii]|uniref:Transferase hexapeptide (Six repeat-containing protein) n=1 Tax=Pedobacter steynii TaxID=430522 RepID=A0A1G9WI23_9SPHI|nr:CatB-related O-acetyltransferase [Pedobacter steynii]NQX40296.1 CatB-related O-acetyltransferase [Pedobacter steynii]SDM83831.1 transferase hexapeptide (six repeat-containing protein) [Pedobacter steynii]
MMIIGFVKRLLIDLLTYIKETYELSKLQQEYPTCEFYSGARISNTTFDQFNIINRNVTIDSCTIGSHTYVQKKSTIFNAEIGRFCSIASGVSIGPGIHKVDGVTTHPALYLKNTPLRKVYSKEDRFQSSKRTTIGHDVWIGERAIIIDGVNIGNGAIIAAGAVVTKNVEAYSIVGGVPSKFIRYRFDKEVASRINESEWWNNSEEWLEDNCLTFMDQEEFLINLNKV